MPSRTEYKAWDLSSPVSDLLQTLSSPAPHKHDSPIASKESAAEDAQGSIDKAAGTLGDFSKIFQFLGVPLDVPLPKVPLPCPPAISEDEPLNTTFIRTAGNNADSNTRSSSSSSNIGDSVNGHEQERIPLPVEEKKDYTSDGAIYHPPVSKGVRFHEWYIDNDLDESQPTRSHDSGEETASTSPDAVIDTPSTRIKTSKKKEKKAKKKAKKRARAITALQTRATSDIESSGKTVPSPSKSPARKASVHTVLAEPTTPPPLGLEPKTKSKKKKSKGKGDDPTSKETHSDQDGPLVEKSTGGKATAASASTKNGSQRTVPSTHSHFLSPVTPDRPILQRTTVSERPVPRPSFQPAFQSFSMTPTTSLNSVPAFLPYVVNPEFYSSSPFQQGGQNKSKVAAAFHQQQSGKGKPFTVRHGTDRHEHFFLELLKQFPSDKKWLLAPAIMSNHSTNPEGIHVFVDASNIFIGFYEHLKKLFGLKQGRIEGLHISFDALVLLLERRRPVAKRVVVGSEPHLPAFEMAKAIGYETSILTQVYKDHELSKRQRRYYYQHSSTGQSGNKGGYANASHVPEMVPDTNGHPPSPTRLGDPLKWVEQGVDELLHLKMLESIVDAEKPGTMVLATGDAAVAEYSQGFLKMVERALSKGWSVELMAWGLGINKAYRDPAFRKKWGDKFLIVELDDFAEDLIDT